MGILIMDLLQKYKDFISSNVLFTPKDKLLLAVSGGIDSVVLCDLTKRAGYEFAIAHCNFQLRGQESERDKAFVIGLAREYGVECQVNNFDTKKYAAENKISIQEAARKLRYGWFEDILGNHDPPLAWLLTAHHADDNIETVMLNFFRGTGIKGLKGMELRQGKVVRPLLFAHRMELEKYVSDNRLSFVTDSSNLKEEYSRNYFRLSVIPMLEKIFPEVKKNVLQNIERFREVALLYEEAVAANKRKLLEYREGAIYIPVLKLKKIKPLRTVLYEISKEWDFSTHQVDDIIRLLDSDTGKYIHSASHQILKNRNWLIITLHGSDGAGMILVEEETGEVRFPSEGGKENYLKFTNIVPAEFSIPENNLTAFLDAKDILYPLILRKWKAGDYFYPLGNKNPATGKVGKKKLARFFIDQKLSKADKEKIWILEMNKKIIWVIGLRIDERFKVTEKTRTILKITFTAGRTV